MNDKEFLLALREYIEQTEVKIDSEFGMGWPLSRLISENRMPEIYAEVLRRVDEYNKK